MRRKEQNEPLRKKQTQKQDSIEYTIDTQISILLSYIKIMPITIQIRFLHPLNLILEKENTNEINNKTIERLMPIMNMEAIEAAKNTFLIDIFCRFLKLNKLRQAFANASKKNISRQRIHQNANDKNYANNPFQPFQPNIQKQTAKFEPIQSVINPNYENLIKLHKTFTDVHINTEYKIKELNENYTFFAPPRFISKVMELKDFESAFPEKGNIVMMSFEGSKIVGKRGFAFVSQNVIYWWQKVYKDVKEVLNDLIEEKQKQGKDKDKKKQAEKDEMKNETQESSKYSQSFKLSYKMIGHHGKITSLSLSDDQYYLISAGTDKVIKLWCLRQKCLLAEYKGHTKTIWSVSFNKSGYFFLSGSADKTIKLWSTDDSIAQRIFIGHLSDVIKVDFMKNPDLIVSASEDKTVKIWNTLTTQCINTFKFDRQIINFKTSISGRYLVTCDAVGKMSLYDLLKGQMMSSFMVPQKQQLGQNKVRTLKIHDMCISMDEKEFTCISSKYIVIYSFDKICEKQSKNIFVEVGKEIKERNVATKEVIYTGRDSNLVYCDYLDKGVLLIATTSFKKY